MSRICHCRHGGLGLRVAQRLAVVCIDWFNYEEWLENHSPFRVAAWKLCQWGSCDGNMHESCLPSRNKIRWLRTCESWGDVGVFGERVVSVENARWTALENLPDEQIMECTVIRSEDPCRWSWKKVSTFGTILFQGSWSPMGKLGLFCWLRDTSKVGILLGILYIWRRYYDAYIS